MRRGNDVNCLLYTNNKCYLDVTEVGALRIRIAYAACKKVRIYFISSHFIPWFNLIFIKSVLEKCKDIGFQYLLQSLDQVKYFSPFHFLAQIASTLTFPPPSEGRQKTAPECFGLVFLLKVTWIFAHFRSLHCVSIFLLLSSDNSRLILVYPGPHSVPCVRPLSLVN